MAGIHVGDARFHKGYQAYAFLNESVMVSKKEWLNRVLDEGIEVLIYNGNQDVIVHVPGMNRVVNSLKWSQRSQFEEAKRKKFWVWNGDSGRGELAAYVAEGGGLAYAVVRKAGHMVPISQPRYGSISDKSNPYLDNLDTISLW